MLSRNILSDIRSQLGAFSERKRSIATFILENHEDAAFLTTAQLAKACGVSESTVTRFASDLGYERYADLQKELAAIVKHKLSQIERLELSSDGKQNDSMLSRLRTMMTADMESIEETLYHISEYELNQVVALISKAHNVYVIGSRSAYGLAHYFGVTLSWIKPRVWLTSGPSNMQFDRMIDAQPGDVALAISTNPYPRNTLYMLEVAKKRGLTTIVVTDSQVSPLAHLANYCLVVQNRVLSFADNVAPVCSLLTGLLALISQHDAQRSSETLKQMEDFWKQSDMYVKDFSYE